MSGRKEIKLPPIPDKRYFTIGETSDLCAVKPHVLRYWEQEFPQLNPVTRRGNRRYYQHKDVIMIREIRALLYEHGFTINGARQQFASGKKQNLSVHSQVIADDQSALLDNICDELEEIAVRLTSGSAKSVIG